MKTNKKADANQKLTEKLIIEENKKTIEKMTNYLNDIKKSQEEAFKIEVEVLEHGKLPTKANFNDAGFDVFATEDVTIFPGQVIKHPLNIKMKLPKGSWAEIQTKSGLGSKGMLVYAGVVDEGYRGIPHVVATNLNWNLQWIDGANGGFTPAPEQANSIKPIVVKKGSKLAQITMHPHSNSWFMIQVDKVDNDTDRGDGGFGSSGSV